jgi:2-hydroxy-4-carboxymuconate semialdehyde hemiacetal dehydrogenase
MAGETTKSFGLCVIGAGAIADRHMQAFEACGGVRPRWVVSRTIEQACDFSRRWEFPNAGTATEAALADPCVEIVLITSPSPLHIDQAVQALQAGKDVVVEIPVAMNWAEAQNIASVSSALGRRVWVCHTLRSMPALREVRSRVRSGRLHLTQVNGFFGIPRRRNQGMGGVGTRNWIDNLLWHHGCHQVDASLWVLDMPQVPRVQALFGPAHPTLGMTLDVGVQMLAEGGELITHSLSYNVERPTWRLDFIGHEDVLSCIEGRLTNEAGEELAPQTPLAELTVQNRELVHAWRTGEACEYDLAGILPTMEVLGRAQRSAESPPLPLRERG